MGARDFAPNVHIETITNADIFTHQCRSAYDWASACDLLFDGVGVKIAEMDGRYYGYVYCPTGRDYSTAVAYALMAGARAVWVRIFNYR